MIEEYEPLIHSVLNKYAPAWLREDCYQAACIGLLKALQNKEQAHNFGSYAFNAMRNEVLAEVALLSGVGNGTLSLDKQTFLLYAEFKRRRKDGTLHEMKISKKMLKRFEGFLHARRIDIERLMDPEKHESYSYCTSIK